jgi:hypothetical protein
VHFSFKALILRVQSTRKMSALSPIFASGVGYATTPPPRWGGGGGTTPHHSQKWDAPLRFGTTGDRAKTSLLV